jgi:tripartite ATP-independent transporter DctM subunit
MLILSMFVAHLFAVRYDLPVEEAFDTARLRRTFIDALPTFALPVIILGAIFGGIVTATEAAGLAVLAALVIGLWYGEMDLRHLKRAMLDGGMQSAVVMLLVAASVLMGGFLTRAQMPQELARAILELTDDRYVILLILNFFFLVIGFFLHSAAAIILVVPIVVPLIQQAGIDPVHFGLVVTLNLAIGQQTPPVASVLITSCSIARANIWQVSKVNIYFVAVLLTVLLISTYIPAIPMFLVEYFYR